MRFFLLWEKVSHGIITVHCVWLFYRATTGPHVIDLVSVPVSRFTLGQWEQKRNSDPVGYTRCCKGLAVGLLRGAGRTSRAWDREAGSMNSSKCNAMQCNATQYHREDQLFPWYFSATVMLATMNGDCTVSEEENWRAPTWAHNTGNRSCVRGVLGV